MHGGDLILRIPDQLLTQQGHIGDHRIARMYEILRSLEPGSRVLDLGCAAGSFPREATLAAVVRVDRDPHGDARAGEFVQGDAAGLPFASRSFDALILNHSLEHFPDLAGALNEIGRVIRTNGALFVAVPDASTLTDKLYRWLAQGGGHVNAFHSRDATAMAIERGTGLQHRATKTLFSSLSFLNRRNSPRPAPRRLSLLGGGSEWSLWLYVWLSRRVDRLLKTHLSVYGWAFYFGEITEPIDTGNWVNVCIRCGSGCSSSRLKSDSLVRKGLLGISTYRCQNCGAANPFHEDT
jgi:SAM-dependent methyltransferase